MNFPQEKDSDGILSQTLMEIISANDDFRAAEEKLKADMFDGPIPAGKDARERMVREMDGAMERLGQVAFPCLRAGSQGSL
jgi:cytochrome c556